MSRTAEDISATVSLEGQNNRPGESGLDAADQIAELLVGNEASETNDNDKEETPTVVSTEEDEESNDDKAKEDSGEDETTLEAVADGDDDTWESVLGVKEGDLSFDEAGDINGVNVKVNGESSTISMSDLIAGFQNNKVNTTKSQLHAETVKEFEVQKGQVEQIYASKLEAVDALSKHFEKQLISEFDNVDWDDLRANNPAEYAAMRSDYSAKANELSSIQEAIKTDRESAGKETYEANQKMTEASMKENYEAMIINNPEWADEKVRNEAKAEFKTFVADTYGFKDGEFESVFDSRLIELIKDAKKFHEGTAVAAKKRVNPVPKFQKSRGQGSKPKTSKLEKLTAASKKATGSAKRDLQQSAVAELLIGG